MQARFLWRALKARWRDQKAELAIIRAHIRPGDTVCDIGAHKGSYLFWLSRWVRHGRVVAFEPQPSLADYLRKIIARMHVTNVTLEQKGVSSFTGQQTFFIPAPNSPGASLVQSVGSSETGQKLTIDVVALDDYFVAGEKISLIKIDAEGAELAIFQGAARILKDSRPVLVFECESRHLETGSVFDVFSYLGTLGYRGQFLQNGALRPLAEFDPAVHQKQSGPRFWNAAGYCNNFVFAPS
jgi:FkbM family methyltransferase